MRRKRRAALALVWRVSQWKDERENEEVEQEDDPEIADGVYNVMSIAGSVVVGGARRIREEAR